MQFKSTMSEFPGVKYKRAAWRVNNALFTLVLTNKACCKTAAILILPENCKMFSEMFWF